MFKPNQVIFEKGAREYPLGEELYRRFVTDKGIEVTEVASNRVKSAIPGETLFEQYRNGKETLVVGVKKSLTFQSCKPSAHYQLPIVSGCMGQCEYCYLNTQLGDKPFVRVHVNVDDILSQAEKYMKERLPGITIFEGAATSDPLPVEPYTHALAKCIRFFGEQEHARFRFVSKFTDVDTLLDLPHNNHTEIRFSLNTQTVIKQYEHYTAGADARIEAAAKVIGAGYPSGFLIAPVFLYENWKEEYRQMLEHLKKTLPTQRKHKITFEVISHRYTLRAKDRINEIFPGNTLPMTEEERTFKYGQFGYGKYVYTKEELADMKQFFLALLNELFPECEVKYVI
ncbi:MAG: spore photoproduct lyase [Lachnospiraceae bacterium]|nr:spore photoproduct lyase [Lachnospiraceae bacterium]